MIAQLVDTLLRSVEGSSVTEIEYEFGGQRLRIVRTTHGSGPAAATATSAATPALKESLPESGQTTSATRPQLRQICASMHGTFYRSTSPGSPAIVEVGQQVQAGDQVALLEAMKMLHSVETEWTGRIVKVLAENGNAVEPGTPLLELEAAEAAGV